MFDAASLSSLTAEIQLLDGSQIDYEALLPTPWVDVTIDVTDSVTSETGKGFVRVPILDGNDAPEIDLHNRYVVLPENTPTLTRFKVADVDITDDALTGANGNAVSLDISITDAQFFEVVEVTPNIHWELYIKAETSLNFEVQSQYTITINVDDDAVGAIGVPDDSVVYTLTLNDQNDPPAIDVVQPIPAIPENVDTSANYDVHDFHVSDEDGDIPVVSLGGADGAMFEFAAASGVGNYTLRLISGAVVDYEVLPANDKNLHVTVIAQDGTDVSSFPLNIPVSDVNDTAPTPLSASVTVPEHAILNSTHPEIFFSDPDLTYTTFSWRIDGDITDDLGNSRGGLFAGAFEIVSTLRLNPPANPTNGGDVYAGAVKVKDPSVLDFESTTLPQSFIIHDVVLIDDDSGLESAPFDVMINVGDVNDTTPVIPLPQPPVAIPEDATETSLPFELINMEDPDAIFTTFEWDYLGNITALDGSGNYNHVFDIVNATSNPRFGAVQILDASQIDFESTTFPTSFIVEGVFVTDVDGEFTSAPANIYINITDVNDNAPVIDVPPALFVSEDASVDDDVVDGSNNTYLLAATDADTSPVFSNWSIVSGNEDGVFKIRDVNSGGGISGLIEVADTTLLDHEAKPMYTLGVRVSDGVNESVVVPVQINVTDVFEPPEIFVKLSDGTPVPDGSPLDFGTTDTGTEKAFTFEVTNQGDSALNLTNFNAPAGFTVTAADPLTVASGATETFTITLSGTAPGDFSGTVSFENNDGNSDGLIENPYEIDVTGEVDGGPTNLEFSVDPGAVFENKGIFDFGTTIDGTPETYRFRVSNMGTTPLSITNIAVPAGFSLQPVATTGPAATLPSTGGNSWNLAPDEIRMIQVSLIGDGGATSGEFYGDLTITSDDIGAPTFTVAVNGEVNSSSIVTIIDDADAGFSKSADWDDITDNGFNGISWVSESGSSTATWDFGSVAAGVYTIATNWVIRDWPNQGSTLPSGVAVETAEYEVDVSGTTSSYIVDQFDRPRSFAADGTSWHLLTTEAIAAGNLTVSISDPDADNGRIVADAVRLERLQPVTDVVTLPAGRSEHTVDLTLNDPEPFQAWSTDGSLELSREWKVEFVTSADANGNPTTFAATLTDTFGTLVANADATVDIQLTSDRRTSLDPVSFRYRLINAEGIATDVTPVTLHFTNDAPGTAEDTFSTSHNRALTFDPTSNDRDPQGDQVESELPLPVDGVLRLTGDSHSILDRRDVFVELPSSAPGSEPAIWSLTFDWIADGVNPVTINNISTGPENDLPGMLVAAGLINAESDVQIDETNNSPRTKRIRFLDDILHEKGQEGFEVSITGFTGVSGTNQRGELKANSDGSITFTPNPEFHRLAGLRNEEFLYTATDQHNRGRQVQKIRVEVTNTAPIGSVAGELTGFYDVPTETLGIPDRPEIQLHNAIPVDLYDADGDPLYFVAVDSSTSFGSFNTEQPISPDGVLEFIATGREQGEISGSPIYNDIVTYRFTDGYSFSPVFTTDISVKPNRALTGSTLFGSIQVTGTTTSFGVQNNAGSATALSTAWRLDAEAIGSNPERPLTSVDEISLDLETGNASFDYALDTNKSPTFGGHSLHYDSQAYTPRPVVQATLSRPAGTGDVAEIRASLSWSGYTVNGSGLTMTPLDLDSYATAIRYANATPTTNGTSTEYNIALQATEVFGNDVATGVLPAGLYRWNLSTTLVMSDGSEVDLSSTGDAFAYSPQSNLTSPFGGLPRGWSIGGIPVLSIQRFDESTSDSTDDDQIIMVFPGGGYRRFKSPADRTALTNVVRNGLNIDLSDSWPAIDMQTRLHDPEELGELRRIAFNGGSSWGPNDTWLYTALDGTELLFSNEGSLVEQVPLARPATTYAYDGLGMLWKITTPDGGTTTFNNTATQVESIDLPGNAVDGTNARTIHLTPNGPGNRWALDELTVQDGGATIERISFDYFTGNRLTGIIRGDLGTDGDSIVTITYDANTAVPTTVRPGTGADDATEFKPAGLNGWTPGTAVWTSGSVNWTAGSPADYSSVDDRQAELISPEVDGQHPIDRWHLDSHARIATYRELADTTGLSTQSWVRDYYGQVVEHSDELNRSTLFSYDYNLVNSEKPVYFGGLTGVFYGYPQATTDYVSTDDGGYIAQSLDARQVASAIYFDNKNRARISAGVDGTKTEWVFDDVAVTGGTVNDVLVAEIATWQSSKLDDEGNVDSDLSDAGTDVEHTVVQTTDYADYELDRLPRTIIVSDNRGSDVNETTITYTTSGEVLKQTSTIAGSTVSTTDFTYHGHNNALKSSVVTDVNGETLAEQAFTYYTSGLMETSFDGLGYTQYKYTDRGLTESVHSGAATSNAAAFAAAYETSYEYHDNGALETTTAPDGHTQTMAFDLAARRNTVTTDRVKATGIDLTAGSTSQVVTTGYDEVGRTTFMSDSLAGSNVDYTEYDRYDRLLETSDRVFLEAGGSPVFIKNTYTYDADGNVLQSKLHGDANNENDVGLAPTSYDYDRFGYMSRYEVVATGGSVMEMRNDALGQTIRDVEYRQTPTVGGSGITGYTESTIVSQASFDGYGRLRRSESPEGNSVNLAYSVSATGVGQIGNSQYPTVTATTSLRNNVTATPDQIVSTSWSDALGRSLASKDPSGTVVYTDYNLAGRLTDTRLLVPTGGNTYDTLRQTRSTIDVLGRPSVQTTVDPITFSLGAGPGTGSQEVRYEYPTQADYDDFEDNAASTYWDTRWDAAVSNRVDVFATGTLPQSKFANDSLGNSVRTDAPDPDAGGPLASPVTRADYDYSSASGYSSTTIDPLGRQWKTDLNSRGQVLENFDADSVSQFSATYDTAGRAKSQVDALNNFTETTFDYATGRADSASVPKEDGETVAAKSNMIYDSAGNLLRLTDPEDNTTVWTYDDLNRRLTESIKLPEWDTDGNVVDGGETDASRFWQYDGLITTYTDRNARQITYTSDPAARTSTETWSDGRTITATANEAGQLTQTVDTSGAKEWTQGFEYDVLGRLDYNTFDYSLSEASVYDTLAIHTFTNTGVRNELLFFLNDEQQIQQTAIVDDLNRITTLTQENGDSGLEQQVLFNYRADSSLDDLQRTEITDSATTPIAFTDFVYFDSSSSNSRGELQTIHHQYQGGGTTINQIRLYIRQCTPNRHVRFITRRSQRFRLRRGKSARNRDAHRRNV